MDAPERRRKRICVIGAGSAGIMCLRALQSSLDKQEFEFVCYERHDCVGGLWIFTGKTGVDDDGLEVHSPMYKNLRLNGPKETIEVPEYLFPETDTSYPSREYLLDYLQSFTRHFDLMKYIKFQTWIEWVRYNNEQEVFEVTIRDLKCENSENVVELFDYVIVCSGHHNYPNYVSYPGEETFLGQIFHAKFFVDAERYSGKRVLLVGAKYSAEDLAMHLSKAKASKVTISYNSAPTGLKLPDIVDERPRMTEIEGPTVKFTDGSSDEYDVIIYCTGYLYSFPFLEEDLRIHTKDTLAPPLYKGVVLPNNPRLLMVGMMSNFCTCALHWIQCHLCAMILKGDFALPAKEEMLKDIETKQLDEKNSVRDFLSTVEFNQIYMDDLVEITGKPNMHGFLDMFKQVNADRLGEFVTHKDTDKFKSLFR